MKKLGFLIFLPLSGCGNYASQLPIDASGIFFNATNTYNENSINLVSELQNDNNLLLYLSNGRYSCLDPEKIKTYITNSPKDLIKKEDEKNKKILESSISVLKEYSSTLKLIKEYSESSEKTISSLGSSVKIFGDLVGAPFSGISAEIVTLAKFANASAIEVRIHEVAVKMKDVLRIVENEINEKYIAPIVKNNNIYFNIWDSCAREKLYYIRDFSFDTNKKLKSLGSRPSSVELANMHDKYLSIRSKFSNNPDLKTMLHDIVLSNNKILDGSLQTSPKEIFDQINVVIPALDKTIKYVGADLPN